MDEGMVMESRVGSGSGSVLQVRLRQGICSQEKGR